MLRKALMGLSLLCCATLLSACKTTGTPKPIIEIQTRVPHVPQSLRHCAPKPQKPTGDDYTQRPVAIYVTKLDASRDDCADKLARVDQILSESERLYGGNQTPPTGVSPTVP